jgi:endonuclease/exonuclease/phosphatase (EEP) superfamily protein YafD
VGARRYWLIWIVVVPVAVWTLVRLFGLDGGSRVAALMAFTPYVAIAALLVAGVAVAVRNWAAASLAALAMVALAGVVLPRAIGDGTVQAAGRETLDVLSANIHHGTADPDALVALVDRFHPDLLSVQELTPSFARKLRLAGLGRRLPNAIVSVRAGASGAGLYSRLPMRKLGGGERFFFRQPRAEVQMPDGRGVRIVGVHPFPPSGDVDVWQGALESLPSAGAGDPWVLVGDFNATLDMAELRDLLDRGYRDAGEVAGRGLEPTWPRGRTVPPILTIDHVLADRRLGVVEYSVEGQPGSDHRAVQAELVLP